MSILFVYLIIGNHEREFQNFAFIYVNVNFRAVNFKRSALISTTLITIIFLQICDTHTHSLALICLQIALISNTLINTSVNFL